MGGQGADHLFGGQDSDTLEGGEGNDTLEGGLGNDLLDGGDNQDRMVQFGSGTHVLRPTVATGAGDDTLSGIEEAELIGGPGDDTFDVSAWAGAVTIGAFGYDAIGNHVEAAPIDLHVGLPAGVELTGIQANPASLFLGSAGFTRAIGVIGVSMFSWTR